MNGVHQFLYCTSTRLYKPLNFISLWISERNTENPSASGIQNAELRVTISNSRCRKPEQAVTGHQHPIYHILVFIAPVFSFASEGRLPLQCIIHSNNQQEYALVDKRNRKNTSSCQFISKSKNEDLYQPSRWKYELMLSSSTTVTLWTWLGCSTHHSIFSISERTKNIIGVRNSESRASRNIRTSPRDGQNIKLSNANPHAFISSWVFDTWAKKTSG